VVFEDTFRNYLVEPIRCVCLREAAFFNDKPILVSGCWQKPLIFVMLIWHLSSVETRHSNSFRGEIIADGNCFSRFQDGERTSMPAVMILCQFRWSFSFRSASRGEFRLSWDFQKLFCLWSNHVGIFKMREGVFNGVLACLVLFSLVLSCLVLQSKACR
jgi:hypothetical protein